MIKIPFMILVLLAYFSLISVVSSDNNTIPKTTKTIIKTCKKLLPKICHISKPEYDYDFYTICKHLFVLFIILNLLKFPLTFPLS